VPKTDAKKRRFSSTAYFQLVLHPVQACANLNELYLAVAKNRLYARQGRAATNDMAQQAGRLFDKDAKIAHHYNEVIADGKWSHMMDQTHIGYTNWQEPPKNTLPKVATIELPSDAAIGVAVEGSSNFWPESNREPVLAEFNAVDDNHQFVEVFNRSQAACDFTIMANVPWLRLTLDPQCSEAPGKLQKEQRWWASVDWDQIPSGIANGAITITGPDEQSIVVSVIANNNRASVSDDFAGFVDTNGYVSIEAEHFGRAVAGCRRDGDRRLLRNPAGAYCAPARKA
jgi:hypothetical protein